LTIINIMYRYMSNRYTHEDIGPFVKRMTAYKGKDKHSGFTLIELMITVAIIGILAAVATLLFMSYRQKSSIAASLASAHSIQASLISYSTVTRYGVFPAESDITSWSQLVAVCNPHGADLPDDPARLGLQNWLQYTTTDINNDNQDEEFSLLLRVNIVSRETPGSQLHITAREILRETY
jgi:prepilin-type N-terminal cleavage/methylation domain-containing protein